MGRNGRRRIAVFEGDERGAAATEYALIGSVVAVIAMGALQAFGGETGALYGVLDRINLAIWGMLGG